MTIGYILDLFFSETLSLMTIEFSIVLAITTLSSATWVAYRNNYDFRRALTYTILILLGLIGLNTVWYLSSGIRMFNHDSMTIAVETILFAISFIISCWIAALTLYLKPGARKIILTSVADYLLRISTEIRVSASNSKTDNIKINPFRETAQQLRNLNSSSKRRGRPKKVTT